MPDKEDPSHNQSQDKNDPQENSRRWEGRNRHDDPKVQANLAARQAELNDPEVKKDRADRQEELNNRREASNKRADLKHEMQEKSGRTGDVPEQSRENKGPEKEIGARPATSLLAPGPASMQRRGSRIPFRLTLHWLPYGQTAASADHQRSYC
jgi:hypothetical protein